MCTINIISSYHFDLIETLTSLPSPRGGRSRSNRRDRGISISSQDGVLVSSSDCDNAATSTKTSAAKENDIDEKVDDTKTSHAGIYKAKSSSSTNASTICGVVSLLECVTGGGIQPDRQTKRALRSKHREFNTRAQVAWGTLKRKRDKKLGTTATNNSGTQRKCYQPRSLPLSLSPNTRVAFAYELTSIAILVDASSSLTSTLGIMDNFGGIGEGKSSIPSNDYCVPLDRLGPLIKTYLQGLVKPINVPPVSVSGRGIALGKWTPNLAVSVVAVYPPTSAENGEASAGLLVRDYRVTDEASALELAHQVERWALREVEGKIAQRLDFADGLSALGSFSLPSSTQQMNGYSTSVKSSMQDILDVGNAALTTLPPEGRPSLLIATDCSNMYCGGAFESLNNFNIDVPVSILDLSSNNRPSQDITANDSQSLKDTCNISGGIFMNSEQLDSFISEIAGSPCSAGPTIDYHFSFKKRSIKPNRLQWLTIFSLSPFTPGHSSSLRPLSIPEQSSFYRASSSIASFSSSSMMPLGKTADSSNNDKVSIYDRRMKTLGASVTDSSQPHERVVLARYNIQPIRIKSLLMTRVVEGYRARRYGANTQDTDKVSIHLVMPLQSGVFVHYEASFVSSPYHIPTVGQAHIKLEISGSDSDFIQSVKKLFVSHGNEVVLHGRRVPLSTKVAAEKVCKLLRWTRKEDYLESYLCLPG